MTRFELTSTSGNTEQYYDAIRALGYDGEAIAKDNPNPKYRTIWFVEVPTIDDLLRIINALYPLYELYGNKEIIIGMMNDLMPEIEIFDVYPRC